MKQILVSGCANCPYLTIYSDGADEGIDSIIHGECKHPSFNTPDWCPLPNLNSNF